MFRFLVPPAALVAGAAASALVPGLSTSIQSAAEPVLAWWQPVVAAKTQAEHAEVASVAGADQDGDAHAGHRHGDRREAGHGLVEAESTEDTVVLTPEQVEAAGIAVAPAQARSIERRLTVPGTILAFSVRQRWPVLLASLAIAALGLAAVSRLPIDAVPDITNNRVQVNALVPQLPPFDVEAQVTYPIETALAGIRGLEVTRSLSRNGFAQVTTIFSDATDVYFASQQVNERLGEIKGRLPPGTDVHLGPISTGLGEVVMWTVAFANPHVSVPEGRPGFQPDGSSLTPEGQRLRPGFEQASYPRTLQDWVIGPLLRTVPGVAGVDVIGGYRKQYQIEPDSGKLVGLGLSLSDLAEAVEQNTPTGSVTTSRP